MYVRTAECAHASVGSLPRESCKALHYTALHGAVLSNGALSCTNEVNYDAVNGLKDCRL